MRGIEIAILCLTALHSGAFAEAKAMKQASSLKLESPAFAPGGEIPQQFTCEGSDSPPPLRWSGIPTGTKTLALVIDDPDAPDPKAPQMTWVHWIAYNIPASSNAIGEGAGAIPAGTKMGSNSWKKGAYGGPCPPIGRHRYFHKLYALDTELDSLGNPTEGELEAAMKGHILAQAELIGTYQKKK